MSDYLRSPALSVVRIPLPSPLAAPALTLVRRSVAPGITAPLPAAPPRHTPPIVEPDTACCGQAESTWNMRSDSPPILGNQTELSIGVTSYVPAQRDPTGNLTDYTVRPDPRTGTTGVLPITSAPASPAGGGTKLPTPDGAPGVDGGRSSGKALLIVLAVVGAYFAWQEWG